MELNTKMSIRTKHHLDVQMAWWTMQGLGENGKEWDDASKIAAIHNAGFTGICGFLPEEEKAQWWQQALSDHQLHFSVNAYPSSLDDFKGFLEKVHAYEGKVSFINAQVMTPFLVGDQAGELLQSMHDAADEAGVPVYIETHRGTITQDLLRTVSYVNCHNNLELTIDFSHYVLAGEMKTISAEAETLLQVLLNRTASIHGRISNGEQIQVDVSHPNNDDFLRWWTEGMRKWRRTATEGSYFPFVCELGPPPYALIGQSEEEEKAQRWEQSLVMASLARQAWEKSI
ncbi:hypothetical protein EV213_101392 [Aureibacillus halotolerans]|uniref:Sugar phosphate isomerase/epimerase n=2 Tax=Aureibacillus halotolerans TaxID=1508390 RepID=A0A4R6U954_9BACI|nr:hypothetical protein EV213_101392 [Aureibacillus halotolerans]